MSVNNASEINPSRLPHSVRVKKYTEIGSGGFGTVLWYDKRLTKLNADLAVKIANTGPYWWFYSVIMDEDRYQKKKYVLREKQVLETLQECPYILKLIKYTSNFKYSFLYLELCPVNLSDLGKYLSKIDTMPYQSWLSWEQVAHILFPIASAVKFLHDNEFIHFDIKPENMLVNMNGTPKLADFGLVVKYKDLPKEQKKIMGTPGWIAPEMLTWSAFDHRCDMFAVALSTICLLVRARSKALNEGPLSADLRDDKKSTKPKTRVATEELKYIGRKKRHLQRRLKAFIHLLSCGRYFKPIIPAKEEQDEAEAQPEEEEEEENKVSEVEKEPKKKRFCFVFPIRKKNEVVKEGKEVSSGEKKGTEKLKFIPRQKKIAKSKLERRLRHFRRRWYYILPNMKRFRKKKPVEESKKDASVPVAKMCDSFEALFKQGHGEPEYMEDLFALIRKMMAANPDERMSDNELVNHPMLANEKEAWESGDRSGQMFLDFKLAVAEALEKDTDYVLARRWKFINPFKKKKMEALDL